MNDNLEYALITYHQERKEFFPAQTSLYKIITAIPSNNALGIYNSASNLGYLDQLEHFLSDLASIYIFRDVQKRKMLQILKNYIDFDLKLNGEFKMPHDYLLTNDESWESIYSNSLFKESEDNHINKDRNFRFYSYFRKSEFELFKKYQAKFQYTGIKNRFFDYLMNDILRLLNGKFIDEYKIFIKSKFCIELDYSNSTVDSYSNISQDEIDINDKLGRYQTTYLIDIINNTYEIKINKITLYMSSIYQTATSMKVDPYDLMKIVYIHELSHFSVIWSKISLEERNFEYYKTIGGKYPTSEYHELYAQFITYKLIKNDYHLLPIFLELCKKQPPIYQNWIKYKHFRIDKFIQEKIF